MMLFRRVPSRWRSSTTLSLAFEESNCTKDTFDKKPRVASASCKNDGAFGLDWVLLVVGFLALFATTFFSAFLASTGFCFARSRARLFTLSASLGAFGLDW